MTAASAKASDAGRRAWRAAVAYVAQAPGTHILFFVTVVTTLVLRGLDEPTATRVLREASTNLVQMSRDAPRVMFLSAFLLDQGSLVRELVVFTAVLVPVERWLGTYRWLAVFAAGHVGATLATTVGIWLQVRGGGANAAVAYSVDVGVSYGAYAAAGVLTYRLPRPAAVAWASVWAATAAYYVSAHGTFTDWGHATALAIGFALGTLVRPVVHGFDLARSASTEERRGRRRPSSWRPPAVWRWLATPPPPARPEQGERVRVIAGAALLGLAAMVLVIAAGAPRRGVALPTGGKTTPAVAVGAPAGCRPECASVVVRLLDGSGAAATVAVPKGLLVRPRERLTVVVDPADPADVALLARPASVRVDGLLGAVAMACALVSVALFLSARSVRRAGAAV